MACRKLYIKPGDESMDKVRSSDFKGKRCLESKVFSGDGIQINLEDFAGIGDASFQLHGIDEWLGQCGVFQWGEVEAVYVVPDCAGFE